jgi:hypothetical protein
MHSCARLRDGTVECWGDNASRQIAATGAQFHEPHAIGEFPGAAGLRCGANQTCVRTFGGEVLCRGRPDGQILKIGLPGRVRDFIIHAAGGCAILDGERVACWNGNGERPLLIEAAAGATGFAVAAPNAERVCVVRSIGAPLCFDAALWRPVPKGDKSLPASPKVYGIEVLAEFAEAKELLLEGSSLCARFGDGRIACKPSAFPGNAVELLAANDRLFCWRTKQAAIRCADAEGRGADDQLAALQKGIPAGSTRLALGKDHACAIAENHVKCWGRAAHGQLGDRTSYLHAVPTRVAGIDDAIHLRVAETLACAVQRRGTLRCWGSLDGRIATLGNPFPGFVATEIPFPERVVDAFVGDQDTSTRLCAKGQAEWQCYAGRRWTISHRPPAPETSFFAAVGVRLRSIAPDGYCGVDHQGQIVCGHRGAGTVAEATAALTRIEEGAPFAQVASLIKDVSTAETVVCGVTEAGRVHCVRGRNVPYVGESSPKAIDEPTIAALTDVRQIVASNAEYGNVNLACALTDAGAVHCWGDGRYGQLGTASPTPPMVARRIPGLPRVVEIGVGGSFACARTDRGEVFCWGSNREGTVPNGAPGESAIAVVAK